MTLNTDKTYKAFVLPILLFLGLTITAQTIQQVNSKAEIPGIPIIEVPLDTTPAHTIDNYEWVTEKEIWYNPFNFSFYVVTESTLIADTEPMTYESQKVYQLNQVDRPPVYSSECLTAKNPMDCSNEKIATLVQEKIQYPDRAIEKEHDGKEIVMFTLNEYGAVEGNYKVLSKEKPCTNCAQAAVDAVAQLDEWYPATKDGQPVKVKIAIPVRFLYLGK